MKNIKSIDKISLLIEELRGCCSSPIEENTEIEKDLDISGDDALELIIAYASSFNVDVSNFKAGDYFKAEGLELFCFLRKRQKRKALTIGDLIKGIEAGRLDDEILTKE